MKKQIIEAINQISNLEERIIFKDIMNSVFIPLYETNEEMYKQLEKRVFEEIKYEANQYGIITGLVERRFFDASHHLFSAMLESDEANPIYDFNLVNECVDKKKECMIMHVFFKCDYTVIRQIERENKIFEGTIVTEKREYPAKFRLRRSDDYINQIEHLYRLFIKNGIPWKTVNCPYAFKMMDVVLVSCKEKIDSEIQKIKINFRKYKDYIEYDVIPIWNVKRRNLSSIEFPVPCEDFKTYQYTISTKEYGTEHAYLVENDIHVQKVQVYEDKLVIMAAEDDIDSWDIYCINAGHLKKTDKFTYEPMTNTVKDSFIERYSHSYQKQIRSKAEMMRYLSKYEMQNYLVFDSFELKDREGESQTYSMNPFLVNEIRDERYKRRLVLYFRQMADEKYLLQDIMSFLTSEVQLLFPEYNCEGILIEKERAV